MNITNIITHMLREKDIYLCLLLILLLVYLFNIYEGIYIFTYLCCVSLFPPFRQLFVN
jgi:hypothetical protein